jgi:hypothetical protein
MVKVRALVLRNNGTEAAVKTLDGNNIDVTFFRDKRESLDEFLRMLPPGAVIVIDRGECSPRVSSELDARASKGNIPRAEWESILRLDMN